MVKDEKIIWRVEDLDDNMKAAVCGMLGAAIAVVWIWFGILGHGWDARVSLVIALALTILLGALCGVIYAIPKTKES